MEKLDEELLLSLVPSNTRLRRLYHRHKRLDREAERFARFAGYSPSAALYHQKIKKEKLRGMDEIREILSDHR